MLDGSVLVAQAGGLQAQGLAVRGDDAARIVQATRQLNRQVAGAQLHDLAAHVRQVMRLHAQLLSRQLRRIAAHGPRRVQLQAFARTDLCPAGVEIAGTGTQADVSARHLRPSNIQLACRQAAVAARHGRAMHGNGIAGRNVQLAAGGQGIVQIQAGRQHRASRGIDTRSGARGVHTDIILRADHAAVGDIALRLHLAVAARIHGAAVGHVARDGNTRLAARAGGLDIAAVAQPAVRLQHQVAGRGRQHARVAHAQARFRADQGNLARVHAAQLRHVQRIRRGRARASNAARHAMRRIDLVSSRHHFQFLRPDAAVDLRGARQDGRVVAQRGIQSPSIDADHAALHHIAVQVAAVEDRRARRQHHPAGVNKTAAVDGHAGRVGDDDLGPLARHLDIAAQLARVGRIDFVEDHARAAARQPRIALYPAARLRLHVAAAVVEDGAIGRHVELAVGIARYARRARRLDIDLRHAIGALHHGRTLPARRVRIGHDLPHGRTGHKSHHAQRAEYGQGQRPQLAIDPATAITLKYAAVQAAFPFGCLALRGSVFSDDHQLATAFIEDDAVQVLVHDMS
nr:MULTISPECIES: hypothetical protein [unclassified Janthinobacterium]